MRLRIIEHLNSFILRYEQNKKDVTKEPVKANLYVFSDN